MKSQPELVGEALQAMHSVLVDPQDSLCRDQFSRQGVVRMTSTGNSTSALITPFNGALIYEQSNKSSVVARLQTAAELQHPLVEAKVKLSERDWTTSDIQDWSRYASVLIRLCENPTLNGPNTILESSALFPVDISHTAERTFDRTVELIYKNRGWGISNGRTGIVTQLLNSERKVRASRKNKWGVGSDLTGETEIGFVLSMNNKIRDILRERV